jgi:hypothetical protein
MIDLSTILEGLIQRTAEGRLQWSRTVLDDRFVTSVEAISVAIDERQLGGYRLETFDETGVAVEILVSNHATVAQQDLMERLYAQARRSALDVQITLDKLARALNL